MITIVTAFIPIPHHTRSEKEYRRLGKSLIDVDARILCANGNLDRCWLYEHLHETYPNSSHYTHSIGDNPKKNSLAYHIVQAQKTELVAIAAMADTVSDVFVWIDYGIFHVPGVTAKIIEDFLDRAENEQAIAIPGCWRKNEFEYVDNYPCWRFCGGVMVVPRKYAHAFNNAMKHEYAGWLDKTRNISWEVNTLARLEDKTDLPIWWYGPCDHDQTMFTSYRATEYADGQQAENIRKVS